MSDYPDSSDLRKIERWSHETSARDLVEFLEQVSNYEPVRIRVGRSDFNKKKIMKVEYHTMGWSGNEDIIGSLQKSKSLFWMMWWQKSERGGHYYFEIPLWAWERDTSVRAKDKPTGTLAPASPTTEAEGEL